MDSPKNPVERAAVLVEADEAVYSADYEKPENFVIPENIRLAKCLYDIIEELAYLAENDLKSLQLEKNSEWEINTRKLFGIMDNAYRGRIQDCNISAVLAETAYKKLAETVNNSIKSKPSYIKDINNPFEKPETNFFDKSFEERLNEYNGELDEYLIFDNYIEAFCCSIFAQETDFNNPDLPEQYRNYIRDKILEIIDTEVAGLYLDISTAGNEELLKKQIDPEIYKKLKEELIEENPGYSPEELEDLILQSTLLMFSREKTKKLFAEIINLIPLHSISLKCNNNFHIELPGSININLAEAILNIRQNIIDITNPVWVYRNFLNGHLLAQSKKPAEIIPIRQ